MVSRHRSFGWFVVSVLLLGLIGLSGFPQHAYSQVGPAASAGGSSAAVPPEEQPDEIKLRSRQFAPEAGVEARLADSLQATPGKLGGRAHVLLQLRDVPSQSELAALEAAGVQLLNYIPRNGWFASMPAQEVEAALSRADVAGIVRWAGRILPEDKVDARIWAGEYGAWALTEDGRVRLTVSFFDDVSLATGRQVVSAHGAFIEGQSGLLNLLQVVASPAVVGSIASEDTVRWVDQVSPPYTVHNDGAGQRTRVDEVQVLPYGLYGAGVTVGIWDGGSVETTHDDFEDQTGASRVTPGESVTVSDHSTHVGGTVAGNGARSAALGGTYRQWRGMAPQADIVSYDFNGNLDTEHEQGIVTHGIDLSQNSWGYTVQEAPPYDNCALYGDYHTDSRMFDLIVTGAHGRRIPVVFSAGNERNDEDCGMETDPPYGASYANIAPPATAKNVICVGATNSDDNTITLFSSWGPLDDGRLQPHVVAPGCERDTIRDDDVYTRTIWSTAPGNEYGGMCGTSMAAPVVSGISALLIEQFNRTYGADPWPSTIKALLVHGAWDMDDGTPWYNPGPDYASGYGLVDAKRSADLIRDRALRQDTISADAEFDDFEVTVPPGTTQLKVTLAWDDPAAIQNANPALVNDLDLVLIDPGATLVAPWLLNPSAPAAPAARGVDRINNLEQVLVVDPLPGTWQISVRGFDVAEAPQDYSLVSEILAFENVYLPLVLRNLSPADENQPPSTPSGPTPSDGATEQDVDVDLSWTGGDPDGDDVTYDVYVADGDVASPDVLACYDLSTTTCNPGTLGGGNQYSWRVVATDEHGATTFGPVWDFTTEAGPANPWTIIYADDFEGSFPGQWDVYGGTYYWNQRNCRPHAGTYSAWAVGGGGGPLSCGSNYPNDVETWLVHGPFDLSDATAAELIVTFWLNTELDWDELAFAYSPDDGNYYGLGWSGSSGDWTDDVLDMADMLGDSSVWVAIIFQSDGSNNYPEGGYVDDVVVRKCTYDTCLDSSVEFRSRPDSAGTLSSRRISITR
jgi:subtilisin family serine protease